MSPLHSTCCKVSKNIRYLLYLLENCFLLGGEVCPPSKLNKFLDNQAIKVNPVHCSTFLDDRDLINTENGNGTTDLSNRFL